MRKEKQQELEQYIREFQTLRVFPTSEKCHFLSLMRSRYQLNNGKTIFREKILKNQQDGDAVIIVPVTVDGNMILTVEPRVHTKEGVGIGLPAGYIEKGETPIQAASRELQEETGYVASEYVDLDGFYQDEGCSSAYNSIVLATGCIQVSQQMLDRDEFIRYFICGVDEAYEMLDNKYIKGSNSKLALSDAKPYLKSL